MEVAYARAPKLHLQFICALRGSFSNTTGQMKLNVESRYTLYNKWFVRHIKYRVVRSGYGYNN